MFLSSSVYSLCVSFCLKNVLQAVTGPTEERVCFWFLTRISAEALECGIWPSLANIGLGASPTAPIGRGTQL